MTGTLVSFVGMAIGGRELSLELDTFQILFFRSLIGLLIVCLVLFNKGWHLAKTRHFSLHLLRNISHFGGQFGWFYGIAYLPLSEVFAIEFTLPVWTAILATLILKEQMTLPRFFAVVFGILGMLVILRPGMGVLNPISLIVLASAVCFGLSHTLTRRIVWFDHPITILFYMTLIQLPFGFFLSINDWNSVSLSMWPWLIIVGITALTAHYCMARAFAIADATIVVPLDFLRLPLIAVIGYLFYNEMLDMFVLIGAFIMLFGNFINIRAEHIKEKSS
ncbi:MAG: DMT family transporter [Desulfobacula sp.]|nr:DMT family transporter [Desulfobacula sp.]